MNATDIMIGDWVYLSETARFPMRVTEIDKDNCLLNFDGNESDPFDGIYGKYGIGEIRLTPEILCFNDFRMSRSDARIYEADLKCNFAPRGERFIYDFSRNQLRIVSEGRSIYSAVCLYVHELQHILRILGYEDVADSFKVCDVAF